MHSKHHTNKLKDWVTLTRRTIGYDWLFGDVFCVISGDETPAAGSKRGVLRQQIVFFLLRRAFIAVMVDTGQC